MSNAVIAYSNAKGVIKSVTVECNGSVDELGIELFENFNRLADIKDIIKSSIDYICDGEVYYVEDLDDIPDDLYEYSEYESKEDMIDDKTDCNYYLYEKDKWFLMKKGFSEFEELETILEQEY